MAVETACRAIMQGVINANQSVMQITGKQDLYISELEFIELYEDKSIACFTSINTLMQGNSDGMNLGWVQKSIHKNPGARMRLYTDISNNWWQRLCVLSENDTAKPSTINKLSFYSSTNNAREEKKEITQNFATLESMIEDISTNKLWKYEKARALFELLIPSYFKETIKRNAPVMWVLDNYSASFPWELLQTGAQKEKPLCIAAPMIRQLATSDYEPVSPVKSNNVIIIGDPDLDGFEKARQLPGAAKEAREVYNLLSQPGYKAKINVEPPLINATHTEILSGLYKQDYKIIHIAAHGFFDENNNNETGILIGRNKKQPDKPHYLRPEDIAQLPGTPELVFINCCFLGKVNAYAEEYAANRGKMAANIGTQLIRKGVKAIVVAGWEVDDTAALVFAQTFYKEMLNGKNFGDAVHAARSRIHKDFGNTNTWGAFQCYGQPNFKLDIKNDNQGKLHFFIAEQAMNKLDSIISKSEVAFADTQKLRADLTKVSEAIKAAGFYNNEGDDENEGANQYAELRQLEANAYMELNDYTTAIKIFSKLFKAEDAGFKVKSLEQFQNIMVRQVVKDFKEVLQHKKEADNEIAATVLKIDENIKNIKQLLAVWETSERYSLIASALKRKAFILSNLKDPAKASKKMKEVLEEAASYYLSAFLKEKNSYCFCNWLSIKVLLGLPKKQCVEKYNSKGVEMSHTFAVENLPNIIKELEDGYKKNKSQEFWDRSGLTDVSLCNFLLAPSTKANIHKLKEDYKRIWAKNGSLHKKAAQKDNFELLIHFAIRFNRKDIETRITELRKDLESLS